MKEIGRTNTGGVLVEMSIEEVGELSKLNAAVNGGLSLPSFYASEPRFFQEFDLSKTFDVIRVYYLNQFQVNEMQNLLDSIKLKLNQT